jgi:hypothetical protein
LANWKFVVGEQLRARGGGADILVAPTSIDVDATIKTARMDPRSNDWPRLKTELTG